MTTTMLKSDSQIQQQVLQELKWDPRVDENEIGVQVAKGIVTLTGTIDSYAKKVAAREASHRVEGVLDVADELVVRSVLGKERPDSEVAKAVRAALEWDAFVPDDKIRTTVSKGWVTLEGELEQWYQREDARRAIERLNGVRGVTNQIVIKARGADAGTVRAAIEEALERQAEREAKRIRVSVKDGTVRLTGTVRSWSEKNAVERAASFAPGASWIENELSVDSIS